jgi:hypothetical protein
MNSKPDSNYRRDLFIQKNKHKIKFDYAISDCLKALYDAIIKANEGGLNIDPDDAQSMDLSGLNIDITVNIEGKLEMQEQEIIFSGYERVEK